MLLFIFTGCSDESIPGQVFVISQPREATVYLNDEFIGVTPLNYIVEPGTYVLTISKDGYEIWDQAIIVETEKDTVIDVELVPLDDELVPLDSDPYTEKLTPETTISEEKEEEIISESIYGTRFTHSVARQAFDMRLAPAASFPFGESDEYIATVTKSFWIGETPVTYQLWTEVANWAKNNGYKFDSHPKSRGSSDYYGEENEPVTRVSWREAIIWCNALTEFYNEVHETDLIPVYRNERNIVIRNALNSDSRNPIKHDLATGFRLPSVFEWQLAARYIGPNKPSSNPLSTDAILIDNFYWTPGNYASGAIAPIDNEVETLKVAWYNTNLDGLRPYDPSIDRTQPVGMRNANALGLYDMSGNISEWVFDYDEEWLGNKLRDGRIALGGTYDYAATEITVGLVPLISISNLDQFIDVGFRIARNK